MRSLVVGGGLAAAGVVEPGGLAWLGSDLLPRRPGIHVIGMRGMPRTFERSRLFITCKPGSTSHPSVTIHDSLLHIYAISS